MACNPSRRMFRAALWSRSREQPQEHSCHRSSNSFLTIAPQPLHIWLVYLGETNRTREPAHSALFTHIRWNCPQPASKMDLFRPALACESLHHNSSGAASPSSHRHHVSLAEQNCRVPLPGPRSLAIFLLASYWDTICTCKLSD